MRKMFRILIGLLVLVAVCFAAGAIFYGTKTVHDLLGESKVLKQSLAALTHEDQIGYAKVVRQDFRDGKRYTTIRFVETSRDDLLHTVLEKEYEIEGDTVHFDALIITFSDQAVMDGKERSLFLWRRVYGETQAPASGFSIEDEGMAPARYADLLRRLRLKDRDLFWSSIWDLANDPEWLQQYGIRAIYGNVVYKKLRPGLIYVFKISASGQVYPEIIPDL